uniref:Uncharacterized protein n=1 Tax=Bos mutus grunniens TaxID=30521 RepID=A0A8B9YW30_BOSMU
MGGGPGWEARPERRSDPGGGPGWEEVRPRRRSDPRGGQGRRSDMGGGQGRRPGEEVRQGGGHAGRRSEPGGGQVGWAGEGQTREEVARGRVRPSLAAGERRAAIRGPRVARPRSSALPRWRAGSGAAGLGAPWGRPGGSRAAGRRRGPGGAGEGRAGPAGEQRLPRASDPGRGRGRPRCLWTPRPGTSGARSPVPRLPGPSSASKPTPGRQGRVSPPPGRWPPPCGAGGPPCPGTRTPGRLEDTAYRPVRLLGPTVFEERVELPLPARKRRRRRWHPTPVLLPGKSHWRRSLVGCSPWGREESDTTERFHFHFSLSCIGEGNGNPLQCSCLENPRDRGARWEALYGVAQSRTRLKRLSSSSSSEESGLRGKQDSPPRRRPQAAPLEASEELLKGGPDPALGALWGGLE